MSFLWESFRAVKDRPYEEKLLLRRKCYEL